MRDYQSLAHTRWDCKYHLVFIPKRRRKVIPDYHCTSASLRSLAGMGQVRAAM